MKERRRVLARFQVDRMTGRRWLVARLYWEWDVARFRFALTRARWWTHVGQICLRRGKVIADAAYERIE